MNILTAKFDSEEEDEEYVPKEDLKKGKKSKEREESEDDDSPGRAKKNAEIDLIWQEMLNEEKVPAPKYQKTGPDTSKPEKTQVQKSSDNKTTSEKKSLTNQQSKSSKPGKSYKSSSCKAEDDVFAAALAAI